MKPPVENITLPLDYVESLLRISETHRIDVGDIELTSGEPSNISLIQASVSVVIYVKTEEIVELDKTNLHCYELTI